MADSQPSLEVPESAKSSYNRGAKSKGVSVIKTFFVQDLGNVQRDWRERKGGHGVGAHVIVLGDEGYSLFWPDGAPTKKYGWHERSIMVSPGKASSQIEFADEEPIVREWCKEALAKRGVQCRVAKHHEQKQ